MNPKWLCDGATESSLIEDVKYGNDLYPTLFEPKSLVMEGKIEYFIRGRWCIPISREVVCAK